MLVAVRKVLAEQLQPRGTRHDLEVALEAGMNLPDDMVRAVIMKHWKDLRNSIHMQLADALPLVTGDGGQSLYWLAYTSRSPLGHKLWAAIQPPLLPKQTPLLK